MTGMLQRRIAEAAGGVFVGGSLSFSIELCVGCQSGILKQVRERLVQATARCRSSRERLGCGRPAGGVFLWVWIAFFFSIKDGGGGCHFFFGGRAEPGQGQAPAKDG